ncbi:MAG: methyl-accepting chemotaxis protein [Gammaproteobacteria bacterium]
MHGQPVALCDAEGRIEVASEAFAGLTARTTTALQGTDIAALCTPACEHEWRAAWSGLRLGQPLTFDIQVQAGEARRWLRVSAAAVADTSSQHAKVLCLAMDITALRDELDDTRTELKVRQDIMNVTSIVSEADKKGDILSCNAKFLEVSKYSADELIGHGHNTTRHPDMPKSVFKDMWNTIGHGKIFRGVVKNRAKDGTPYYVDAVIAPILGENGKPKKYLGVRYDITEMEIERQNARGVLGAIDESFAYVEFDLGGHVLSANANFLTAVGYRAEEVVGRHHRMFVAPSLADSQEYDQFWKDLAEGKPRSGVFKRLSKTGAEIYIQATYAPVKDEMGRVTKVVKIATEITAQKRYEMAVEELLRSTSAVMSEVQVGNLSRTLDGHYEGEFARLQQAVNGTIAQLREVVDRIRSGALNINSAASEVAKGNTELSTRTEEQASSLEETAASMEQMTSTVQQNAENSRLANQLAASASAQATQGGEVVESAVSAMAAINQSSRKIADIIGVIDEIAFQTNLLALNAAVEAARAGEQGRGFAVVASEVRNLAQRSASAAKEIKALINDSVHKVAEGSRLVDESGRTLTEIVGAVRKVSDIIAEIAVASEEQASGIQQVNTAVTQMDQMTQQNAALVEEAAAASEAMDEETRVLLDTVGFFTLSEKTAAQGQEVRPSVRAPRSLPSAAAGRSRAVVGGETWAEF